MLELSQALPDREVTIESKEISLNFDSRIARGLVVTVRALDQGVKNIKERRITVSLKGEGEHTGADAIFQDVAKAEIHILEQKKSKYADSDILLNHLASLYALIGDCQAAIAVLREGLSQTKSDILKNKLASVLMEVGELSEADKLLSELKAGQRQLPALVTKAYIAARQGDIDSAKNNISSALNLDYFDYATRLFAGALFIWEGQYAEAIRSFKTASEERPKSSVPLVHMAAAYFALGQRQRALSILRRATNLNPLDDRAVSFYSDLLFLSGHPELAIRPLEKLHGIWGRDTSAQVLDRLTKAYLDSAQYTKAAQLIQSRLSAAPGNIALLNNAGIVLWKKGDAITAKRIFADASEVVLSKRDRLSLNSVIPVMNLLTLLLQLEEYWPAATYAKRLLGALPQPSPSGMKVDVITCYVEALAGLGRADEATDIAESTLRNEDEEQPSIFKLVSFLLYHYSVVSPNKERVRELARKAFVATSRTDVDERLKIHCANNAIFSLLQFDELRQASTHLQLIAKQGLKNPYVTATFGLYYLKKNQVGKGRELYERAIQLANNKRLKSRIRQRMAFELAKLYIKHQQDKDAFYWVERSIREKLGLELVRAEAIQLRQDLIQRKLH